MRELVIEIPDKKALREFQIIKQGKNDGYNTNNSWNEVILKFQWKEFYKKEIELWNQNNLYKGLPLQSWIYNNRVNYIGKGADTLTDREILRAFKISGRHIGNSFHSPFYIQQFIKEYKIKSIYDPCGGWGHRLLGAWNIEYIYNDVNPTTYQNCVDMYDFLKSNEKVSLISISNNKYFYNEDSSFFTPKQDYEAVFTCPPYFDTEIYSEKGSENLSHEAFLEWWKRTIEHSFKDSCKYFAYVINKRYCDEMNQVLIKQNFSLEKQILLGKANNLNHFQRISTNSMKGEVLNIFIKI